MLLPFFILSFCRQSFSVFLQEFPSFLSSSVFFQPSSSHSFCSWFLIFLQLLHGQPFISVVVLMQLWEFSVVINFFLWDFFRFQIASLRNNFHFPSFLSLSSFFISFFWCFIFSSFASSSSFFFRDASLQALTESISIPLFQYFLSVFNDTSSRFVFIMFLRDFLFIFSEAHEAEGWLSSQALHFLSLYFQLLSLHRPSSLSASSLCLQSSFSSSSSSLLLFSSSSLLFHFFSYFFDTFIFSLFLFTYFRLLSFSHDFLPALSLWQTERLFLLLSSGIFLTLTGFQPLLEKVLSYRNRYTSDYFILLSRHIPSFFSFRVSFFLHL